MNRYGNWPKFFAISRKLAAIFALLFLGAFILISFTHKNQKPPENQSYVREISLYEVYKTSHRSVVFLGDSIIYQGNWSELLDRNDVVNRGITGDTTRGILKRLDYVTKLSPKLCFVLCGINDILKGRTGDEIASDYEKILFRLKSDGIRPVLLSTLFVTRQHPDASRLNERVKKLNASLRRFALENGLDYVDLNASLSRDGYMIEGVSYDGLHPNGRGYVKIAEIVEGVLQKRLMPADE